MQCILHSNIIIIYYNTSRRIRFQRNFRRTARSSALCLSDMQYNNIIEEGLSTKNVYLIIAIKKKPRYNQYRFLQIVLIKRDVF